MAAEGRGRAVPAAKLHLTLVFLGEVDPGRVGALQRAVGELPGDAVTVELDVIGKFRRTGVAWAGCRQPSKELLVLQAALQQRVRAAGFFSEERAFVPHLTLARRVREVVAEQAVEPVSWRATTVALVESGQSDGAYRNLAEWTLREGED
jgi:2'-5' RNA ligase